ncbi:ribosomal protein L18 [Desulfonatronospira thiodismutans ASO3-1]|uniref:Large ribosomal subunit protein uL18 n=1 Tax=Desulfonatronospira thiodismutans ASO3-1 TaxID=555779 RepID=D6SUL7_9BACT|nr:MULTISPECIES: 50S ribosomal protein L18 [Desulfonatronospira]EFI32997.1 ribosomal protein L18 [Desulfonatronospira thiodismutans ASO3-1]RQD74532.1 MAG: 50S ribosomal protein L18 [Desulfonatronospira sp. MSAO_Bac3]
MKLSKNQRRIKRKYRIRKKIRGTAEKPRLVVFRSNKHIYAQIVDDADARTLAACSTHNLDEHSGLNATAAQSVGSKLAEQATSKNISTVVFDRNGYYYHGRIKALADAARAGGLKF